MWTGYGRGVVYVRYFVPDLDAVWTIGAAGTLWMIRIVFAEDHDLEVNS
jgi:hypothetical protein